MSPPAVPYEGRAFEKGNIRLCMTALMSVLLLVCWVDLKTGVCEAMSGQSFSDVALHDC